MKIKLGSLRSLIRNELLEACGGTTIPPRPVVRNPISPSMSDREQIGRNSIKDKDDPNDIAPHLREPQYEPEECYGPVPPTAEDPYALPDFYAKDYGVLPTSPIKR